LAEHRHPAPRYPAQGRTAAGARAGLLRSKTVGALVAIALLVATIVGAAVWLSILEEQRQQQDRLTSLAHQAALQIRGRLVETEQLLLMEGPQYSTVGPRFRRDMDELLQANPALVRVELRRTDGALLDGIDAPAPRPLLPARSRDALGVEAAAALESAARLNRLTYSRPYFTRIGEVGVELFELVVPTGDVSGLLVVAIYAPQRMLEYYLSAGETPGTLYSLTETDGTVVARQPELGQVRGTLHAISPLARSGIPMQLRVDGVQSSARLVPNLLTGLVAAVSVGLGIAMFFLIQDVRRRARAEDALSEQMQFRRTIEDAMIDALLVFDLDDRVVHVNKALCRITGYPPQALLGAVSPMPFTTPEALAEHHAYHARIERARQDGPDAAEAEAARGYEAWYRTRAGEDFPARVIESPLLDADGRRFGRLVIAVDLRDQKRVEDLARRQQEALQSRSRLATLGEMASTLSHELNQPLAAITSYAAACENLVAQQPARPEQVGQALRGIRTQAERAGQVVRSVQAFLRRRAVERVEIDLGALVRGVEPLLRLQAARTGARIEVDVPPGMTVFADRVMLEQVLLNLARNGFEAMADVPATDRVLQLAAARGGDDERGERVDIRVTDRGRGVPPEVVSQLFNAFFTTKSEGMGLGLSLCRSVIEQHGGHLVYRPRPGGGSVFAFDLPRRGEAGVFPARPGTSFAATPTGDHR
jgi:two-component system sensor histidine kinase DctS